MRGFAAVSSSTVAWDTAGRVRRTGPTGLRRREGFASSRRGRRRRRAAGDLSVWPPPAGSAALAAPCAVSVSARSSPAFSTRAKNAPDETCLAPAERSFCSGPPDPTANSRQFGLRDVFPSVAISLRGRVPVLIPKVPVGSVLGAACAAAARLAATDPLANQVNTLPSIRAKGRIAIRPDRSRRVLRGHRRLGLIVDALRHETRIAV